LWGYSSLQIAYGDFILSFSSPGYMRGQYYPYRVCTLWKKLRNDKIFDLNGRDSLPNVVERVKYQKED